MPAPVVAPRRFPAFRVVDGMGAPTEGPYPMDVVNMWENGNGIVLDTIEASEVAEILGPYKLAQYQTVAQFLGYRYHVVLHFSAVEGRNTTSQGLGLLHRLWKIAVQNQVTYAALQFQLFTTGNWIPMVPASYEWAPRLAGGKQGLFEVSLAFQSRELFPTTGEWGNSQW